MPVPTTQQTFIANVPCLSAHCGGLAVVKVKQEVIYVAIICCVDHNHIYGTCPTTGQGLYRCKVRRMTKAEHLEWDAED